MSVRSFDNRCRSQLTSWPWLAAAVGDGSGHEAAAPVTVVEPRRGPCAGGVQLCPVSLLERHQVGGTTDAATPAAGLVGEPLHHWLQTEAAARFAGRQPGGWVLG